MFDIYSNEQYILTINLLKNRLGKLSPKNVILGLTSPLQKTHLGTLPANAFLLTRSISAGFLHLIHDAVAKLPCASTMYS